MRLALASALLLTAGHALGQVYECKQQDGSIVVQYNVPCKPGTENKRATPTEAQRRAEEKAAAKAQQQRDNEAAVFRREVKLGMNADQVARVWGNPVRRSTEEKKGKNIEYWYWICAGHRAPYGPSISVRFENGIVAAIRNNCA